MIKITDVQQVNEENLFKAREKCYEAFKENIDGGESIENSCEIIKTRPRKRIHKYWKDAYIALNQNQIISGISTCPYKIHFHSSELNMVGIGDVFSLEKGTDAIRVLFSKVFEQYKEFGLSVLYPFSDCYYSRYGYAPVFFQDEIHATRKYIEKYIPQAKSKLRKATKEDIPLISKLYENKAKDLTGTAIRDDELDWIYSNYATSKDGYIAYGINNEKIIIRESVGLDSNSILSFCLNEFPKMEIVVLKNTFSQDFFPSLPEHNLEINALKKLHGMARIINLENCLNKIKHFSSGKIALKINDDTIADNNRTVLYTWNKDKSSVTDSDTYDIKLDIRELCMLVCNGYRRQIDASKEIEALLKDAFPKVDSACYEIF